MPKRVIVSPKVRGPGSHAQNVVWQRRRQRVTLNHWLRDSLLGTYSGSLKRFCDEAGVHYGGMTRLLRSPAVQAELNAQLQAAVPLMQVSVVNQLMDRLEGELNVRELTRIGDFGSKLQGGEVVSDHRVLVNINLPPGSDYSEPVRVTAVTAAQKELGDLLE